MRSLRTLGEVGETPEETYLHSGALREGRVCLGGERGIKGKDGNCLSESEFCHPSPCF